MRAEEAANGIGQSLNAWLVDAVRDALDGRRIDLEIGSNRITFSDEGVPPQADPGLGQLTRHRRQRNRSTSMHTFETPGPITLVVRAGAGHVTVRAEDTPRHDRRAHRAERRR